MGEGLEASGEELPTPLRGQSPERVSDFPLVTFPKALLLGDLQPTEDKAMHRGGHIRGPAEGAQIDEWSTTTAARMMADGYMPGVIIRYLEGYGLSFFAAQALVRQLQTRH